MPTAIAAKIKILMKAVFIRFTVSTRALRLDLAVQGVFADAAAASSLAMVVPAVAGMAFGQWLGGLPWRALFQTCFFVSLMLLGAYTVVRRSTG